MFYHQIPVILKRFKISKSEIFRNFTFLSIQFEGLNFQGLFIKALWTALMKGLVSEMTQN